jgi:hypothetical protein
MPTFYHIQRPDAGAFKAGRAYLFGKEENYFSRDLFKHDPTVSVAAVGKLPVDRIIKDYFEPTGFNHFKHTRSSNFKPDEKGLLACAASVLTHQAKLLRELIFEQVRSESFPGKPSRLRCIWLIPHDRDLLLKWSSTAPKRNFRVYEVDSSGNIHQGLNRYLIPECFGVGQLRENAKFYWSEPVQAAEQNAEILCEGEIRILSEVKIRASRGDGLWDSLKRPWLGSR